MDASISFNLKDIWTSDTDTAYPCLCENVDNETDFYHHESLKHVLSELSIFDQDSTSKLNNNFTSESFNNNSFENLPAHFNNNNNYGNPLRNFTSKFSAEQELLSKPNPRRNMAIINSATENFNCNSQDNFGSFKIIPRDIFGSVKNTSLEHFSSINNAGHDNFGSLSNSNHENSAFSFEGHKYVRNTSLPIDQHQRELTSYQNPDFNVSNQKIEATIDDFDFNIMLDDLMFSSNKTDQMSKNNVTAVINSLMSKKLNKKQYQSLQNVVLEIYRGSNYYSDPLQAFYNHELLMMLLKNQSPGNNYGEKRFETSKSTGNLMNSGISLKEEIALLSKSYRNVIGVLESDIEKAAALYRTSANAMAHKKDAVYQWNGILSPLNYKSCQYSRKVFLGGVPWDSTEEDLIAAFIKFGFLSVVFPQNENASFGKQKMSVNSLRGYCYIIFENEESVNKLTASCIHTANGEFYKISSPKFRSKDVQVIPWIVNDSGFSRFGSQKPDSKKTVFIGALHGMITSSALAMIMDELFDNVVFTALDTDKYKYPIGSGRVTFSSQKSYMRAVTANFVHIKTTKFNKTIQIDPYLEDSMCNNCFQSPGIYFCRSFECFRYFCSNCWQIWHNRCETLFNHKPLRRTFKPIFESK